MNKLWKKLFGKGNFRPMLHGSPIIHLDLPFTKAPNTDKKEKSNKTEAESTEAQAKAAIEAERKRIAEIDEIAALYDPETVYEAKYGKNPCTAAEMSFIAAKKAANQGQKFLSILMDEYKSSGAAEVGASYIPEDDSIPLTPEQRMAQGSAYVKKVQKSKPTQGGN